MQKNVIIYNPKNGSDIKNFRWLGTKYNVVKNSIAKFIPEVAEELVKRYGFLVKVNPEQLEKVMEEISSKEFKCEYCDHTALSEEKLKMHMVGKHKLSNKAKEILDSIPEAEGQSQGSVIVTRKLSIEEQEGIPNTHGGEIDGWYGEGLTTDTPSSMNISRPGMTGHFGAS